MSASKRRRSAPVSVALFPFLAVLLCTMGSLIVVLVLVTRQARMQGTLEGTATADVFGDELEEARWRIAYLKEERERILDELARSRAELAYTEQRVREAKAVLEDIAEKLRRRGDQGPRGGRSERELDQLVALRSAELARLESELARMEAAAAAQPPRWVVVPYQGRYGTQRSPIYIECLADRVIVQPEGVTLLEQDFQGPLGPGNPMAAVVRAVAEDHAQRYGDAARPYPLLLVRPEGIGAYYVAREALMEWRAEFGYELVEADWDLAFPEPDARLRDRLLAALDDARQRQRLLMAAAPRRYGVVPRGGFSLPGGPERSMDFEPSPPGRPRTASRSAHGGAAPGESHAAQLANLSPISKGLPSPGAGSSQGVPQATAPEEAHAGVTPSSNSLAPAASGRPSEGAGDPSAAGSTAAASEGATGEDGAALREGDTARTASLARRRGPGWAVPAGREKSVPLWRSLPADCHGDQIVLHAEGRDGIPIAVPFEKGMEPAVDELVSALWKRIESWGPAGHQMHWRPRLKVRVWPSGEFRFEQLRALLADSGIDVLRDDEAFRPPSSTGPFPSSRAGGRAP